MQIFSFRPVPGVDLMMSRFWREGLLGLVVLPLTVASGWFHWSLFLTALFLVAGFVLIIQLLPILLNLSRTFFSWTAFYFLLPCGRYDCNLCLSLSSRRAY